MFNLLHHRLHIINMALAIVNAAVIVVAMISNMMILAMMGGMTTTGTITSRYKPVGGKH